MILPASMLNVIDRQMVSAQECDTTSTVIVNGARGDQVVNLQKSLKKVGFDPGVIDGIFGGNTEAAVKQFQAGNGLLVDGKVGPNTKAALCSALGSAPDGSDATCDTTSTVIVNGARGDQVVNLQKSLKKVGFDPGVIDGIFGGNTEAAVKQFQAGNGLLVDGKVGPNTKATLCSALNSLPVPPNPVPPNPVPPNPVPPAPNEVTTGTGDFVGTSEPLEPNVSVLPKDQEPEELRPDPEAFELAKDEANSPTPPAELSASLEEKNVIESSNIASPNTALGIASANRAIATASSSLVGAATSVPPSLKFISPPAFEGINSVQGGSSDPPDVALASGDNHVIEMVNLAFRIYNKTGNTLVPGAVLGLNGLFRTNANSISDPNIVFDNSTKRFFASLMDITNQSIKVAVSAPNDPNPSTWNVFNFRIGRCPDQPFITVSSNKVAVSFNTFTSPCVAPFIGAQTLLINKDDMINARPPAFHLTAADPNGFREFPVRTSATDERIFLVGIPSTGNGTIKLTTFTGVITTVPPPAAATSSQLVPFLQKSGVPNVPPDGLQPGVAGACAKGNVAPPCIDTADAHITGASMSPDNKVLWLTFPEACKNPAPAPARQIISCIRLIELDTDASPIGAARAAIKFDFDLAERNMDLYYPTLTFTGSRAQGTNNMIVSFGGSNTTVFPSLFASGQRGPVGLLLKLSLLPLVQLKSGGSPHLPLLGPPPVTRYGDYFGAAIDPTNSSISWMAGEYMQAPTIPPAVPFPLWSTVLSAVTSTPGNGNFLCRKHWRSTPHCPNQRNSISRCQQSNWSRCQQSNWSRCQQSNWSRCQQSNWSRCQQSN